MSLQPGKTVSPLGEPDAAREPNTCVGLWPVSTHCKVGKTKTAVAEPMRLVRIVSDAARMANKYSFNVPDGFEGMRFP